MCDEAIIVRNQGTIFLGGPPLVKAATGEVVTAEDLGGADVHSRISGVADHYALERRAMRSASPGGSSASEPAQAARRGNPRADEPLYPADELYGIIPTDTRQPFDVREVIARIVDGCEFDEFKPLYGRRWSAASRISGAIRSGSSPTTASCSRNPPSRERTSSSCAASAASRWCSCRTSLASWSAANTKSGGIAKDGAKMVTAVACAQVPKFTVDHRRQLWRRQLRHVRPGLGPRFLWMWPNARISVMGGEQAAGVLARSAATAWRRGKTWSAGGRGGLQGADPRPVRAPGPSLLRQRPAVG